MAREENVRLGKISRYRAFEQCKRRRLDQFLGDVDNLSQ